MGNKKCCVNKCSSKIGMTGIHLYRFPKDVERCQIWKKNCNREDLNNLSAEDCYKHYRVCNLHFENSMLAGMIKERLKSDAIPTIFKINDTTDENTISLIDQENNSIIEINEIVNKNKFFYAGKKKNKTEEKPIETVLNASQQNSVILKEGLTPCYIIANPIQPQPVMVGNPLISNPSSGNWNAQLVNNGVVFVIDNLGEEEEKNEPDNIENETELYVIAVEDKDETTAADEYIINDLTPSIVHNYAKKPIENISKDLIIDNDRNNFISSVCGICNNSNPVIKNIDDVDVNNTSYRDKLKLSFPDISTDIVNILKLICSDCCDKLLLVYEFRLLYQNGAEKLKNTKHIKSSGNEEKKHQKKITENVKDFIENPKNYEYDEVIEIDYENIENKNLINQEKPDSQILRNRLQLDHTDLTCNLCKIQFPSNETLLKHKASKHKTKNNVCGICHKKFSKYSVLKKHLISHTKLLCSYCPRKFLTKSLLENHETLHASKSSYKCSKCNKIFETKTRYLKHTGCEEIKKEKQYMCDVCGKIYGAKLALVEHMRTHTGAKPFKCVNCNKDFRTRMQLMLHRETHNEYNNYVCEDCGKSFKTKRTFKVHRKIHTDFRPYVCKYCDRKFLYKKGLLVHTRSHTNERPFVCTFENCKVDYKDKNQLKKHILRVHTKVKNFKCQIPECGREFYFSTNLRLHMERHTKSKAFECKVCNKMYVSKTALLKHMKSVHNELLICVCNEKFDDDEQLTEHCRQCVQIKNYCQTCDLEFEDETSRNQHECPDSFDCTMCTSKYTTQRLLKEHEKTHMEPVMCEICHKLLRNANILKKHMLTHTSDKPFCCEFCGKKFRQKVGLKIHRFTHTGERLYSCNLCDKSYRQPGHLRDHKNMHMGIKPYKCELCTKSYRQKRDLTLHLEKVHGIISKPFVKISELK